MNVIFKQRTKFYREQYTIEITNIDRKVLEILITLFKNVPRKDLNKCLESVGGAPDIISEYAYEQAQEFSQYLFYKLHQSTKDDENE